MGLEAEPLGAGGFPAGGRRTDEDSPYHVLSTEDIVKYMVDTIKEVNTIVEVTQSRIVSYEFYIPFRV